GVAVGALVAGVGFLVSPYNRVVPLPACVRAAASLVWNRQPLLAPSAELARRRPHSPRDGRPRSLPHLHRRHHRRRGRPLHQRLLLPRPRLAPRPPASTSRRRASCRTSPEAAPPEKRPSRLERTRLRPRWERPQAPRALLRAHLTPQSRYRRR